jgi:hypothetical protein
MFNIKNTSLDEEIYKYETENQFKRCNLSDVI